MGHRSPRRPDEVPPNPAAELAELRARYRQELPRKVGAVKQAAATVDPGRGREAIEPLHLLVHRLVGSAAIYGFAEVSQAAATLEDFLVHALDEPPPPSDDWARRLLALVADVERAASKGH